MCRIATGFRGGVGGTRQELCGALSGGVMLIAARHGRAQVNEKAEQCKTLTTLYRERFLQEFGATRCCDLLNLGYGTDDSPCWALTARAARILLETLD